MRLKDKAANSEMIIIGDRRIFNIVFGTSRDTATVSDNTIASNRACPTVSIAR